MIYLGYGLKRFQGSKTSQTALKYRFEKKVYFIHIHITWYLRCYSYHVKNLFVESQSVELKYAKMVAYVVLLITYSPF